MNVAADTVAQNIIYEGLLSMVLSVDNDGKVASSKKTHLIQDQSAKTIPYF